ncbi:hypothetical protein GGP76_002852 [Salinibacter ruber]|nr:sulfotransferase [Salinibacter ruber]MCS3685474.1 hypothetical protein [Salinibacter ruber]
MKPSLLEGIGGEETKVVQVVGTPRSGSSLLATMLDSHSEMACLLEPFLSWLLNGEFEYKWSRFSIDRDNFKFNRPHQFLSHLCENENLGAVGFKETYRTSWHPAFPTKRFFEENYNTGAVEHTVAIIRDPRDTWASVIRRNERYEGDSKTMAELMHAWNELCSWVTSEGIPYIRYEDLTRNPHSIDALLNEVGLEMEDRVIHPRGTPGEGDKRAMQGGQIDSDSIGRYKDTLRPAVARFIEAQCQDFGCSFGYK